MKRIVCLLLVLMAVVMLTACWQPPGETVSAPDPAPSQAETTVPTTEPSAEQTTEATQPPEATTEETFSEFPYLLTVENHDQMIFDAPTYDSRFVDTVHQAGVYTIVEEVTDDEGLVWGKLKSGAGWLELGDVSQNSGEGLLMSAAALTYTAKESWPQLGESTFYSTPVIIHAYEPISEVLVSYLHAEESGLYPSEPVYAIAMTDVSVPVVIHLEFPGDLSMYSVSFMDADGTFHHYRLAYSGRNNALLFYPYTPA